MTKNPYQISKVRIFLILMIIMAMNQHQSGGRCDRLLQVTLTARFSIDPLSLCIHTSTTRYTSTTSKTSSSQHLNLFYLFPVSTHTSSTSKTYSSQHLLPLLHWIQYFAILWLSTRDVQGHIFLRRGSKRQIGGEEEEILSGEQANSQKMDNMSLSKCC